MKSRFTVKSSLIALVASSALLAGQVYATSTAETTAQTEQTQQKGERGGKHHGKSMHKSVRKMLRSLDLTETQKTDVKAVFEKYKEDKADRPSAEERAAHKAEMLALISNANFDDAQADAIIDAKQLKMKEGMKNFMKMQNEIYQLLTDEQKEKFDSRFTKVKSKGRR
ncbi:Spy/CpxP family protein refolding chaperone [Shewanella electrodiphila]|uniref:Spy/CpxP family protein refolding chaperone n=1 Tax=Shewanella electrodiphila TaxID=934143 RepID=A0ABT0KUA6_9GAMM|nr:Spy/CpxP family protein refolding chaperone [Shewanella electrodiphila]MCL1047156.1 Spy/CpxP family protein refolding chaperone [Shewanella electrodiphila]